MQIEVTGIDPDSFSVTGGIGTLTAGDNTFLTISYAPQTTGTHSAEVIIHSDDVAHPETTLVVYGNSYRKCSTLRDERCWSGRRSQFCLLRCDRI